MNKSVNLIGALVLLVGCTPGWQWRTTNDDLRQFIRYDEEPGYCFGQCPGYFIYVFDDGEIVYHGEGTVDKKGLKKKTVSPALFQNILAHLEDNDFDTLAPRYWFEYDVCGEEYITDAGQIHLTLSLNSGVKKVIYDYGCHASLDKGRILSITDFMQRNIPVANWVGRQHFNWANNER